MRQDTGLRRLALRAMHCGFALVLAGSALALTERSAAAEDYYEDKTIKLIVPHPAVGTFDTLARIVTQHMPRFIPGEPTMIVENMPGGGGIIGTRAVSRAKADGLMLLHTASMAAIQDALGEYGGINFAEFDWLGSVAGAAYAVILKSELADQPLETLRAEQTPIKLGVNGPGGLIYETSKLVSALSGLNI
jgi:tripartite-type tricarboxylate transporter receptor subunit TctC